jgi:hypothetical protein
MRIVNIQCSRGRLFKLLLVIACDSRILLKRRKQGKETAIELKLLPKYSSPNKQIRLMRKLNSGGFGVVWEATSETKSRHEADTQGQVGQAETQGDKN